MCHTNPMSIVGAVCALAAISTSADMPTFALLPGPEDLTFEGIGAVSAGASSRLLFDYPEPQRSQILDLLFLPKYGAAFQHLKVEVGGDMNATDGTEPSHERERGEVDFTRGHHWWLMKEAAARNPDIVLDCLAWGAPGWFEGGFWSQDCADYYVRFIKGARDVHGLTIRYVGLWNEREFDPEWVKRFRRTLDAAGLHDVTIVASDMNGPAEHQWKAAELAAKDPELANAVGVFGVHYPYSVPPDSALAFQAAGKRLWSSEDGEWNWETMRPLSGLRAAKLNRNIVERRFTKTNFWSLVTGYYDNLPAPDSGVITASSPWSGAFLVKPELWHIAHTTQFVAPGWRLLRGGSGVFEWGSVAAYGSPDGSQVSVVIETLSAKEAVSIRLLAPEQVENLYPWLTYGSKTFEQESALRVNGSVEVTIPPQAVMTLTSTTGQQKGSPPSPAARPFPLPYRQSYDDLSAGSRPPYAIDYSWAFEATGVGALRQVIRRQGITWIDLPYAATYLGEPTWQDVKVSARVSFDADPSLPDQWAGVVLRSTPGSTWARYNDPNPAGITLKLFRDGRWRVTSPNETLAEGLWAGPSHGWNRASLEAHGPWVEAFVGDVRVATVPAGGSTQGLAGLACGNHTALFDDLQIARTTPSMDVRHVPFSRWGCWLAARAEGESQLTIHDAHHDFGRDRVLRIEWDGPSARNLASHVATPDGKLKLWVVDDRTLGLEASDLSLRLTRLSDGPASSPSEPEWSFRTGPEEAPEALNVRVVTGALSPDGRVEPSNGWVRLAIRVPAGVRRSAPLLRPAKQVAAAHEQWHDFLAKMPAVADDQRAAATQAWYALWAAGMRRQGPWNWDAITMSKVTMSWVWSWDHCFTALALGQGDMELAMDQWMQPFPLMDATGRLPDMWKAPGRIEWYATKPPIHGWALSKLMDMAEIPRPRLAEAYRVLERWTEFWFSERDRDRDGVPSYLTLGNDSGWDNATLFDEGCEIESPELSAYLILQMKALERVARNLGDDDGARKWNQRRAQFKAAFLAHSWNGERFLAKRSGTHEFDPAPSSMLPLMTLALGEELSAEQVERNLQHLQPFMTEFGPASERPDSPKFKADGYWRGPIWAPTTYLLIDGLRRAGRTREAEDIATRFLRLGERSGGDYENYHPITGEGLCAPGYTWTAAVRVLLLHEYRSAAQTPVVE